jgi:hypothetical protein
MVDRITSPDDSKNDSAFRSLNGVQLDLDADFFMPACVMRRVNALKNLQVKMVEIETQFYEKLHLLECEYAALYAPLYEKREKIVNGQYEPTQEEAKWFQDEESGNKAKREKETASDTQDDEDEDTKGIPQFWLQAFKSTDLIMEMLQLHDEPVLKHLRDIRVRMHDTKPYGYTLEFHFNENEYFTNKVLTKTYELTTDMEVKDPFSYDGSIIYKCKGCVIDWKKDMNVTVKQIKKKQKHKNSGTIRVITKEVKQDSFFNFFNTPTKDGMRPSFRTFYQSFNDFVQGKQATEAGEQSKEDDEDEEGDEQLCEADFELGHFFKEFLVPKAVLYFTGELIDEASEGEYDEVADDDDDEEANDDDHDDDERQANEAGIKVLRKKLNFKNSNQEDDDNQEDEDDGEVENSRKSDSKKS